MAIAASLAAAPAQADPVREDQWHLRFMHITEAQAVTKGEGITVAVLDSGVDPHPDLRRNLLQGRNVLPGGKNYGNVDEDGHGTQMAGLISAHGNGKFDGAVGIAPASKILPVRVAQPGQNGGSASVAAGIEWAAAHSAQVINFSGATGPSLALNSAMSIARQNDALIVAAIGNKGEDVVAAYPASLSGVLAVGASNRMGRYASISVASPNVQLCAPGIEITTTSADSEYYIVSGTSPATAIVSGAAALVRAKYPNLSAQQVIHRLTATATDIGKPGRDDECGFGVLNVVKALTADVPLPANSDPGTGSAGPTAAPTADAAPSAGGDAPAPDGSAAGSNTPMVVGGAVAVIVLLGGLLALLAARRRRSNS